MKGINDRFNELVCFSVYKSLFSAEKTLKYAVDRKDFICSSLVPDICIKKSTPKQRTGKAFSSEVINPIVYPHLISCYSFPPDT